MNQATIWADSPPRTSEERRVPLYGDVAPTQPADVDPDTPLDDLHLNWTEKQLPERVRTKHVHRLHPYLGKYIPQLVEIFLRKYFRAGQSVLDPFCGSGTTLVQANELGVHSLGFDISAFNVLVTRVKTDRYDVALLRQEVTDIVAKTAQMTQRGELGWFNEPVESSGTHTDNDYLKEWFAPQALTELLTFRSLIDNYQYQDFLKVVLSRSARSARLTTHFDLDFPKKPVTQPYQCYKHSRTCEPTKTAFKFLSRYATDSLRRVEEFAHLQTPARAECIHGDSRFLDMPPIDGIITSPPYVGLIDYHEQHRYAYELLGLQDNRTDEIGPAANGQSKAAKASYSQNMASVLRNIVPHVRPGGPVVIVAADRHELYPEILGNMGFARHHETIKRHVNRRTGRRSGEFYESIFVCLKE